MRFDAPHGDGEKRGTSMSAFTMAELLAVMAIMGLMMLLLIPSVQHAMENARSAACSSNLRQFQAAYLLYLKDHQGRPFPFFEDVSDGRLWYFGLEPGGPASGPEGARPLDPGRARLAPYMGKGNSVRRCPSLPYGAAYFKQKFEIPSTGYGINLRLLAGAPGAVRNWAQVSRPADFLVWADSIQINTWQAPASSSNPMLEEWYYVSGSSPAKFHFRHGGHLHAAFGDGRVHQLSPGRVDPRVDGQAGFLKEEEAEQFLNPAP